MKHRSASSRNRPRRIPAVALLLLIVIPAAATNALADERRKTDEGDWNGTWYYTSRDEHIALFVRGDADAPEIKIRFESTFRPEQFETAWNGGAEYLVHGRPATVRVSFEETSEIELRGTWTRSTPWQQARMEEQGSFHAYRTSDGRWLVMQFDPFSKTMISKDGEPETRDARRSWTFRKASRRIVLWEELPF